MPIADGMAVASHLAISGFGDLGQIVNVLTGQAAGSKDVRTRFDGRVSALMAWCNQATEMIDGGLPFEEETAACGPSRHTHIAVQWQRSPTADMIDAKACSRSTYEIAMLLPRRRGIA